MFERYHIKTDPAPKIIGPEAAGVNPIPKFNILRQAEICLNCGRCAKSCIYDAHRRDPADPRQMAEAEHLLCKNCFRCIQDCPSRALTKVINPDYRRLGNDYWRNDLISRIWAEAETGHIPVLGAGYRGKFGGPGFEGMWTDMSEIVRPTRDGIHGREYINTGVDLGKKVPYLSFGPDHELNIDLPPLLEIPLPMIFNPVPLPESFQSLQKIFIDAAAKIKTMAITPAPYLESQLTLPDMTAVMPRLTAQNAEKFMAALTQKDKLPKIVELEYTGKETTDFWGNLKQTYPKVIISLHIPFQPKIEQIVVKLVQRGVEMFHLYADQTGHEFKSTQPRFLKELIRSVHLALVDQSIRDEVTLMVSGGIAGAEHIPKAIICGADVIGVDMALTIGVGCRVCQICEETKCPVNLARVPADWGAQRLLNLMAAWRDQLLEILSAMGIREVRRLRGETGRAIFQEEMEKELKQG